MLIGFRLDMKDFSWLIMKICFSGVSFLVILIGVLDNMFVVICFFSGL